LLLSNEFDVPQVRRLAIETPGGFRVSDGAAPDGVGDDDRLRIRVEMLPQVVPGYYSVWFDKAIYESNRI
jgi:hypothetical protein